MMLPISVVIPTYNRAKLLPRAIESALAACAPGDEIVVADDGSIDDTQAAIAPYRTQIRYLLLPHGGMAATRNAGMAAARHDLVAFLDSDDEFMPDKLTLQRAVLAHSPDVVMVLSDFAHRSARGGVRRRELANWTEDRRGWEAILGGGVPFTDYAALPTGRPAFQVYVGDLYPLLVARSYAAPLVAVVRRDRVGAGPWFPEDLSFHCDWEALARFARYEPTAFLDCETAWNWGHDGPRMTDISQGAYWAEYLTMIQRLWGQDTNFLTTQSARYQEALYHAHKRRARWLLKEGRLQEARGDLRAIDGGPLAYRLAAAMPERVITVQLMRQAQRLSIATARNREERHIPLGVIYWEGNLVVPRQFRSGASVLVVPRQFRSGASVLVVPRQFRSGASVRFSSCCCMAR